MPSLRKRAGSVPAPAEPIKPAPIEQAAPVAADPARSPVPDAEHALAAVPPGMSKDEAVGILADAQRDVGAAMAQPTPPAAPEPDSASLQAQVQAMRDAEQMLKARRAAEVQAEIQAAMNRDGVPADSSEAQQQQQPAIQFTPAEIALNQSYPDLLTNPALAQMASLTVAELARHGFQRGTPEYENRLAPMFEYGLANARQRSVAPAATAAQPAPINEPEPEPERRTPVSAPVSREIPSSTTGRPPSETRVTLSAAEREHAKLAGISEVEFARQKLKLQALKASGHYREQG
jgi:hypothetical protein